MKMIWSALYCSPAQEMTRFKKVSFLKSRKNESPVQSNVWMFCRQYLHITSNTENDKNNHIRLFLKLFESVFNNGKRKVCSSFNRINVSKIIFQLFSFWNERLTSSLAGLFANCVSKKWKGMGSTTWVTVW